MLENIIGYLPRRVDVVIFVIFLRTHKPLLPVALLAWRGRLLPLPSSAFLPKKSQRFFKVNQEMIRHSPRKRTSPTMAPLDFLSRNRNRCPHDEVRAFWGKMRRTSLILLSLIYSKRISWPKRKFSCITANMLSSTRMASLITATWGRGSLHFLRPNSFPIFQQILRLPTLVRCRCERFESVEEKGPNSTRRAERYCGFFGQHSANEIDFHRVLDRKWKDH